MIAAPMTAAGASIGMSRKTGVAILVDSLEHLHQSIAHILTTPLGSRVMRRDYGSELPDLIDQPLNASTRLRIYATTAIALQRWEKRIRLRRVQLIPSADGRAELQLELQRTDMPRRPTVTIAYPLSSFGA
jgi:phage baseplate assembly protein W